MTRYIVTNLRFPDETYRELRYQAARRGTSVASVVRESVNQYLGRGKVEGRAPAFGEDPADALVGTIRSSVTDESVNHDHYLYGWPKEADRETSGRHERSARSAWAPASAPTRSSRRSAREA